MNQHLQDILDLLKKAEALTGEDKAKIKKSVQNADKELTIAEFKLERTEKVKRTTSILLEETIEELEQKRKVVEESREELQRSLEELKATQEQLVQQEKLASLGQLTAGIAHEIKNPLNFVNNFSELSLEYIDEIKIELAQLERNPTTEEIENLLQDVEANLKKINEYGERTDGIVKSMLMHSRGGTGVMEPTNLNKLIREYVNLAFHGMRAGKNAMNVKIDLDLDERIPPVSLNMEDFSRIILNLCKNAFDAMYDKSLANADRDKYMPTLNIKTFQKNGHIHILVEDNGPGIPEENLDKILQPFFTTKKGTEGTGLGLSITNDIIKAHKGTLNITSKREIFTRFDIALPA